MCERSGLREPGRHPSKHKLFKTIPMRLKGAQHGAAGLESGPKTFENEPKSADFSSVPSEVSWPKQDNCDVKK